ncbi:MAG: proline racemase family protein [Geminicoccaceae bacterium]
MRVVDSHTEGEPTRVILEGGPELGGSSLTERAARFERMHRDFQSGVLLEPRGHDAMVGALLVPPSAPDCVTGVIYFNPVGNLGMCGHATIGTAVTLAHLGRIEPGRHRFDTPVGVVTVDLLTANEASVENVESYRHLKDVLIELDGAGTVTGDVAWGGNWFFLIKDAPGPLTIEHVPDLTRAALDLRNALLAKGVTGADGAWIDHVEFTGPAHSQGADGCNFVLCPGGAYDRSPCGTGTSAKLACLAEDGRLAPGETWVQESVIGSSYRLSYRAGAAGGVVPTITGRAYVTAETRLLFDPADPYRHGIRASGDRPER